MEKNNANTDELIEKYMKELSILDHKLEATELLLEDTKQIEVWSYLNNLSNIYQREKEIIITKIKFSKLLKKYDINIFEDYKNNSKKIVIEYKEKLNKYLKILVSDGFDDNELEGLKETYDDIHKKIKQLKNLLSELGSEADLHTNDKYYNMLVYMLKEAYYSYIYIEADYNRFFEILKYDETISKLSGENVKYIIDNTSLAHLVFTNNTYPKIGSPKNLNRMFNCQFHKSNNETLDMRVKIHKNYFQCFGCGIEGNQINYLMQYEGITYDEAIYLLAEIYLIDIPGNPYKNEKNSKLVNKYRNKLVSDEYMNFLIESYNAVKKKDMDIDLMYANLFMQVQRVRNGITDPNFVYQEKTKKFKLDSPVDLKKVNLKWNPND